MSAILLHFLVGNISQDHLDLEAAAGDERRSELRLRISENYALIAASLLYNQVNLVVLCLRGCGARASWGVLS